MGGSQWRPSAAYGLIWSFLIEDAWRAGQEALLRAESDRERRAIRRALLRYVAYLVGGTVALWYFNDGFVWTPAMTVGAVATGLVILLDVVWVGRLHPTVEMGPLTLLVVVAGGAHLAVLSWGWVAFGPATAVPWLFIELGSVGLVREYLQARKLLLLLDGFW